MKLLVRVMAPAPDAPAAERTSASVLAALAPWGARLAQPPAAYRKIAGWWEHVAEIAPATEATFDAVVALAPDGWDPVVRDGECDAVWNPRGAARFLVPDATWAHVLLIHEPAETPS